MVDKIKRKTKSLRRLKMSEALREMDKIELINIERLAHLLKSLTPAELETLEILLDGEAYKTIAQSLEELREGQGIPIDEW
ncbi:MAG: hypothetical protein COX14_03450 [Chloroflexi bacterium CG23_combo_of_CG06-09_8_20_14_all_45_10]|nr:MAG: hypothetical protein COX14_03450 [Chloroflexi bacterium CG23_combo_of_CG06-09_8_20_14_all_45_10]